jgi:hypothetical protein
MAAATKWINKCEMHKSPILLIMIFYVYYYVLVYYVYLAGVFDNRIPWMAKPLFRDINVTLNYAKTS